MNFFLEFTAEQLMLSNFKKSSKKKKRIWFDPCNFLKNFSKYVNFFFQIIVPKIVIANGLKAKEKQIVHVQDLPQCPPTWIMKSKFFEWPTITSGC